MGSVPERVREQLRTRFEQLRGAVHLRLYTRPGSSRLILPAGVGCATCEDARQIAQALRDAALDKVQLDILDITRDEQGTASRVTEVPTIVLSTNGEDGRIRFQGLPAGTEFAALVDAVERVSRNEHGLGPESLASLAKLTEPVEIMVFATPT